MPISRNFYPLRAHQRDLVVLAGRFEGNAGATPTEYIFKGVDDITWTGAGTYTLTLPGKGSLEVLTAMVNVTESGSWAKISVNETTRVATIRVYADVAGTPTLTNVAASEHVHILVIVRN